MKLYLDTCAVDNLVENKSGLNERFVADLKTSEIIISVYTIYEIVNQKGMSGYAETLSYLSKNYGGFKIDLNEHFPISSNDFLGKGCSKKDFMEKLYRPVIAELTCRVVNRLFLVWHYLHYIQSILNRFCWEEAEFASASKKVREKIQIKVESELTALYHKGQLTEKAMKVLYEKLRSSIHFNIYAHYISAEHPEFFGQSIDFLSIDFSLPYASGCKNPLKIPDRKSIQEMPEYRQTSYQKLEEIVVSSVMQKINLSDIAELEKKSIETDIRDIFVNNDIFKSNNYIDLFILQMYWNRLKDQALSVDNDPCYLITADGDFLKKMEKWGKELSIQGFEDSVRQSNLYFPK